MGKLKINNVDILQYTTPIPKDEVGTAHPAFISKIKGISSEVDNGTKKIITGWSFNNTSYDAGNSKIKVNGVATPVMIDGTRPRNVSQFTFTGTGFTKYLNNINGNLYLSNSADSASGTFITSSKCASKNCLVNIACWASGGKGGNGSYVFLTGNWGGVGGAGGSKIFFTVCIKNNTYAKLYSDSDSSKRGRLNWSETGTYYDSPRMLVNNVVKDIDVVCTGGQSGTGLNRRQATDNGAGGGKVSHWGACILVRKKSHGANKNNNNGNAGYSCTFSDVNSPYFGNPEGHKGSLNLTGAGGKGAGTNQAHGTGGSGGYGNGGNAGDVNGKSPGVSGTNGGGGGGAGSPAGGANGGDGGYPGFIIYY